MVTITGAQIRAARAFLRWTIADLAEKAGISAPTVVLVERVDGVPTVGGGVETTREYRASARAESLEKIAKALSKAGVTFLPDDGKGQGVRWRNKSRL
jgi:transcriptional regulator with XRE-family HTH domain